jgi:uncharacterized Ntn-hydrolase superfamily protein
VTDVRSSFPGRSVSCYSIVARDPTTGELGVAVQSHWFSIGALVPWTEAGVGAIASQGFSDGSYGVYGLDQMRAGRSAPEVLDRLLSGDVGRERRQVAMVDAEGRVAAHTGAGCFRETGHVVGDGFAVVASMARSDAVWKEMVPAFESAGGNLAGRLLAALDAAEAAGGELRGKRSAALIVVPGASSGKPWLDRVYDLRVEDHPEPLLELRRLVQLQTAYNLMGAGQAALEKGDLEAALAACVEAGAMFPDNAEMVFWPALVVVLAGRLEEALPLFRKAFRLQPSWVETTRRLPAIGLLPDDPVLLARIVSEA